MYYLIMFHTSEISRKVLSLLNHIPLSSEQARALACAASERCPAAAPATQAGVLPEPGVVPAVPERSRAAPRTWSPCSHLHQGNRGDHAGGDIAFSWQLASSALIVWPRGKIRRIRFPAVVNVPFCGAEVNAAALEEIHMNTKHPNSLGLQLPWLS